MMITDVRAYCVQEPVPHAFRWRDGLPGSGSVHEGTWIRILTDQGVSGWSHVDRGPIVLDLLRRRLREVLVGRDPMDKERLWHEVWEIDRIEELPIYVLGAVDIALWDLCGKVAGVPVRKLLGGYRDAIPAYASTVTFDSIEEYLDVADQCLERGFTAIKLHAWGDPRRDARLGEALRAHVGDEVPLMYDGSAGFDLVDSLYLGRALEAAGFLWYEEPMREFSIDAYRRLAAELAIPVLAPETMDGCHFNAADFVVSGAADMLRTSTHYKGGFTGGLRIAHLADCFHMRAEVHGGGPANLELALAIRNTTYYESLVTSNPIEVEEGIDRSGLKHGGDTPGVDWGIEEADLARRAVATL
jgi:L-alanine-DL-glutamate epimerase-like enolase superfamily enzyme